MTDTTESNPVQTIPAITEFELVILVFHDGPVDGIARITGKDSSTYRFVMLDWDERQGIRFFALSLISDELFRTLVSELGHVEKPTLPTWVPQFLFPTEEVAHAFNAKIEKLLSEEKEVIAVMAMDSWGTKITAFKTLGQNERFIITGSLFPPTVNETENKVKRDWARLLSRE